MGLGLEHRRLGGEHVDLELEHVSLDVEAGNVVEKHKKDD